MLEKLKISLIVLSVALWCSGCGQKAPEATPADTKGAKPKATKLMIVIITCGIFFY